MSTTTTTTNASATLADKRDALTAQAVTSYLAAERDDAKRGAACRDFQAVIAEYTAQGMGVDAACDAIAVHVDYVADGRIKAPKAATIKAHAAAWRAVVEHYNGRGAVTVAGAAYIARQSKREGGAAAVATILEAHKTAAETVAALDAMPAAGKAEGKPAADRPLKADDVVAYLARVEAQAWEGEDVKQVLAALAKAGKAVQSRLAAQAE